MSFAAVAGAVGVVGGALISSNASSKAAKSQQKGTNAAISEQARQYDLTRGDYAPYREAGARALGSLETDIDRMPTPEEVMSDPGYQFGLTQGQQALDRKQAAQGGRVSGAALKAASSYATNYAATGYGAAYQRRQDRLNRLAALAGIGQTATSGSAQAGSNSANAISGLLERQGDASGAATLAQGNIWASTGNQLAAMAKKGFAPNVQQPGWTGYGGSSDDPWYG